MITLCFTLADGANLATIIGVPAAALAAWFAYGQLKLIKQTTYSSGFIKACELLQDEKAREERGFVYTLNGKPFEQWSKEEKNRAEMVCQKFDTVGAMAANGIITYDMVMHWGNTIERTWEILKPLVEERRILSGDDFWDDYQFIANYASKKEIKK